MRTQLLDAALSTIARRTGCLLEVRSQGGCLSPVSTQPNLYNDSNSPDGNVVEKGAQGFMLRSTTTRILKTCSPVFASCTGSSGLTDFNTSITPSLKLC